MIATVFILSALTLLVATDGSEVGG